LHSYEVNVYNQVLDTVIESISSRFEKHGQLCADFACLDPNNFKPDETLQKNAHIGVFDKISNYCPGIIYEDFQNEYIDFTSKWKEIKKILSVYILNYKTMMKILMVITKIINIYKCIYVLTYLILII
jgi:hypothetical protein